MSAAGTMIEVFWGRDRAPLLLAPGEGWGDGRHETTRLCLQALGFFAPRNRAWRLLDFGSGSGLLSIAGARLGATVVGVEIDERGLRHSDENARLNGVAERVSFVRGLEDAPGPFDLVIANILRPVLAEHADPLIERLKPGATLVLSGLVASDVPVLEVRYARPWAGWKPEVSRRGDWCVMVWKRPPEAAADT